MGTSVAVSMNAIWNACLIQSTRVGVDGGPGNLEAIVVEVSGERRCQYWRKSL